MPEREVISDTLSKADASTSYFDYVSSFISDHEMILAPLLLLIIIYSLKYFFGNNFNKKSALEFFLEFPVDFGFIGITFVFTYSFLDLETVVFGKIMILICIVIALINVTLRRFALSEYYKESSNNYLLGLYGVLNSTIAISFVYFVLSTINKS